MDDVRQPGDDVLPYNDFALRVSLSDVDDLEAVLRAVPRAEVRRLQRNGARYYRYFYWGGDGLALELVMAQLQRRAEAAVAGY